MGSPIVLVQKKDGSTRFCVDYWRLNSVTKKDAFPLSRVHDSLDALGESELFSTHDLASGYWQVELDPADREKTTFTTHQGLYEFTVMPFGLCNAPGTFQLLMNSTLSGLLWSSCLVYLDDVIIFSKKLEEHLVRLINSGSGTFSFSRTQDQTIQMPPTAAHRVIPRPHHQSTWHSNRPKENSVPQAVAYPVEHRAAAQFPRTGYILPLVHRELCQDISPSATTTGEECPVYLERELRSRLPHTEAETYFRPRSRLP